MNNQHKYKLFRDNEQYTLRKEIVGGFTHYYIAYTDDLGKTHDEHVTRNIFAAYLRFGKDERNMRRWSERYIEKSNLTEATLHKRALRLPKGMEDLTIDAEQREMLWQAIGKLPEIQRQRLLMYYFDGLTYEEIAELEACKKQSIHESVQLAIQQIREKLVSIK